MKVGYVRTSTREQNTARQDLLMEELGVEKIYTDKVSGKNMERPELHKMMDFVRAGDVVIVESFSRFARNTRDLLDLTATLTEKGVQFVSKKECIDTSTPAGKFMLTIFAALAELAPHVPSISTHSIANLFPTAQRIFQMTPQQNRPSTFYR